MEDHAGPIMKGKRTKRQRPQSPVPFEVAASSPTTATSSAELFSSTTEEEEDMANCLILLAQGQEYRKPGKLPAEMDDHNHCRSGNNYDEAVAAAASPKFTSRRYLEMATSTGSRAGYYVYQCKTCNRTFPSFQALGGHRASHKKPKNNTAAAATSHLGNNGYSDTLQLRSPSSVEKKQIFTLLPSDEEEGRFRKFTSLSLQLGRHSIFSHGNNNPKNGNGGGSKVHECSICGAEFTSGQALGGHMRRHRAAPVGISDPNTVGAITTLSLTPLATFEDSEEPPPPTPAPDKAKANNLSLDLDLNLPASAQDHQADHHHRDDDRESCRPIEFTSLMEPSPSSQQQIEQKNQPAANNKSSLVFSASPALVDCHY